MGGSSCRPAAIPAGQGEEGPIIRIGSALGSSFGQFIAMPTAQRIVLVAVGALSKLTSARSTLQNLAASIERCYIH